jgi:hypothetical protein
VEWVIPIKEVCIGSEYGESIRWRIIPFWTVSSWFNLNGLYGSCRSRLYGSCRSGLYNGLSWHVCWLEYKVLYSFDVSDNGCSPFASFSWFVCRFGRILSTVLRAPGLIFVCLFTIRSSDPVSTIWAVYRRLVRYSQERVSVPHGLLMLRQLIACYRSLVYRSVERHCICCTSGYYGSRRCYRSKERVSVPRVLRICANWLPCPSNLTL